jgi:hypothetical protein
MFSIASPLGFGQEWWRTITAKPLLFEDFTSSADQNSIEQ